MMPIASVAAFFELRLDVQLDRIVGDSSQKLSEIGETFSSALKS
jgi:hypothetical protein